MGRHDTVESVSFSSKFESKELRELAPELYGRMQMSINSFCSGPSEDLTPDPRPIYSFLFLDFSEALREFK